MTPSLYPSASRSGLALLSGCGFHFELSRENPPHQRVSTHELTVMQILCVFFVGFTPLCVSTQPAVMGHRPSHLRVVEIFD